MKLPHPKAAIEASSESFVQVRMAAATVSTAEAAIVQGSRGAMAMLAALDFAHTQPKLRPVSTYTFAAPRVTC